MGSQTFEAENITLLQEAHPGPYNFYYLYYNFWKAAAIVKKFTG